MESSTNPTGRVSTVDAASSPPAIKRKKVCHIAATNEGAPWMGEQLRELRDQYGFDVAAVVSAPEGKLIDRLRSENIPFHVANFNSRSGAPRALLELPLAVLRLARILRRERYDIVQTHIFSTTMVGRPAAWLADVPIRLSMMAGPFHLEAHTSRWIDRATCWMETAVIPACENSLELCREIGIPEHKLALIYYSVDERKFDPRKVVSAGIREEFGWPADTPLICMVAYFYARLPKSRWIPESCHGRGHKGHGDLVRAAPIVLSEFPNAKFLLVGCGWAGSDAYLDEIRELVRASGLEQSVMFTGYRADASSILCEATVAVQASLSENLGGTIEALLMECPMVVTRTGGMPDAVRDGETGIVVNPSDPTDLARGIIQALRDPERAQAMARAGRKLMLERFTLNRTVADLAELYDRLIAERVGRRRFFSPLVSAARAAMALPILLYISFRLYVIDLFVPIYLPAITSRFRVQLFRLACTSVRIIQRFRVSRRMFQLVRAGLAPMRKSRELDD